MKLALPVCLKGSLLLLLLTNPLLLAQEVKDAPSASEVSQLRKVSATNAYNEEGVKEVEKEVQLIERPSLLKKSEFLSGPFGFALLPKGSVVAAGKSLTLTATPPEKGKMLPWKDFYQKHRGSIRLLVVTEQQWSGKAPLTSLLPTLKTAAEGGMTTVTSLQGQPISFPPLQEAIESEQEDK